MKKNKVKPHKRTVEGIPLTVLSTQCIASKGIGDGKLIPLITVIADQEKLIEKEIMYSKGIDPSRVSSLWGTDKKKQEIYLMLQFKVPLEQQFILNFNIEKYSTIIDQIVYAQALYLTVGNVCALKQASLYKERLLIEVPSRDFKDAWEDIYKRKELKYLKKEYNIAGCEAEKALSEVRNEFDKIKKLRNK